MEIEHVTVRIVRHRYLRPGPAYVWWPIVGTFVPFGFAHGWLGMHERGMLAECDKPSSRCLLAQPEDER